MRLTNRRRKTMAKTEVDKLLRRYVERFEAGGSVDPSDLLSKLEGAERAELDALIEGYLEQAAPKQAWDPDAFEGSISEQAVAQVAETWSEEAGQLPHELVRLRQERKLTRAGLVERLADALGVGGKEEKVRSYYHQLEFGLLPSEGVSAKVFDALASLLDTTADALRKAGESVAPSAGGEPGAAYARLAHPGHGADESSDEPLEQRIPNRTERESDADWDEVDRLFRGGD